jgi:hypothetical protein
MQRVLTLSPIPRPKVAGKFIQIGNEKMYVKDATYGPFKPEADGCEYHCPDIVERDFALMAAAGINSVRTVRYRRSGSSTSPAATACT